MQGRLENISVDLFVELIRQASTDLPQDVETAISQAYNQEAEGSLAKKCLSGILKNISIARQNSTPMCQDTGTNIYFIESPFGVSQREVQKKIQEATIIATQKGYLRPNTVDSITGKILDTNQGEHQPSFHFEESETDEIKITLILKGGGCENVGRQYALPYSFEGTDVRADRDLKGVKKCVIDAVYQAQGKGCAPGIVSVAFGGDRLTSYLATKEAFKRSIGSQNTNPLLAKMEQELKEECNQLGIGPMGYGGKTTLLDCFVTSIPRVPASFFVSISYMCWTFRRRTLTMSPEGQASYV